MVMSAAAGFLAVNAVLGALWVVRRRQEMAAGEGPAGGVAVTSSSGGGSRSGLVGSGGGGQVACAGCPPDSHACCTLTPRLLLPVSLPQGLAAAGRVMAPCSHGMA